jgi:hypothetical protein
MPILIADHRWLAQDDLSDCIGNVAYYLSETPTPGAAASAQRVTTTAASSAINTVETLLIKAPLVIPRTDFGQSFPGTLNVGTLVRATLYGTCTATAANASTFTIRAGILGTTADASVATAAVTSATSGSAIPFQVVIDLTVQTLGAAGTAFGSMNVTNTGVTGIAAVTNTVVPFTSSTLATTTATWLDITYVTAVNTTTSTFQNCTIEIFP